MITVLLCTYNRSDSLRATLASLAGMSVPKDLEWELVIADNNSDDDTRDVIQGFSNTLGNIRYVFEPRQGHAFSRNTGVQMARGEIIAFTDDDVIVHPQWLAEIRNTFERFPCSGVAGRVLSTWGDVKKPEWAEVEGLQDLSGVFPHFDLGEQATLTGRTPWGCNMAFRKIMFDKYGLFRTDLNLLRFPKKSGGGSDADFALRLFQAGEKIAYAPGAIIYHPVAPERTTRSYALAHFYDYGRTCVVRDGWPQNAVCYFGIPRYMVRAFLENLVKWVTTLDPRRRFHHKLESYRSAGSIVAAYRLSKR